MENHKHRQSAAARRLRAKLHKSRESLADQFEFKMFVIVNFKNDSKKRAVFEIEQVYPLMTNDYEHKIIKGVEKKDLISKDTVQLHARKWQCKRRDVIGCSEGIDFMIWPRNDIQSLQCQLFSRWRHETDSPFKPYASSFTIDHSEYESQLANHIDVGQQNGYVLTNPEQNVVFFLSRHNLDPRRGQAVIFRIHSLCVYLSQAELMNWGHGTMERVMKPVLDKI